MKRKLTDRHSSSTLADTPVKVKEEDQLPLDPAQDGKKRGSASRTGTACDRCRVRKMRCDDNPGGCASCRQAQTECKTTDRITGKATGRGYVDTLEHRLAELELQNSDLQAQVVALGGQAGPPNVDPTLDQISFYTNGLRQEDSIPTRSRQQSDQVSLNDSKEPPARGSVQDCRDPLPPSRKGLYGNNYFGISSGNNLICSVRATSMNVLGMEIDLTDYLSPDVDEPDPAHIDQRIYNKSYRAFVQTAFGMGPKLQKVELPARSEGLQYAEIFLRITAAFVPVVHKPSFMNLVLRFYDDPHFEPTVAEIVTVHAALAIAYCQFASRGATNPQHQREIHTASNFHYHYALGFFAQLMASHTLADVQALALLCIHLRNCPKPGASWMLTSIVLDLAMELGLHRSAKNWAPSIKRNVLEVEMRKRVFWSINWIHVLVGGSLGRPMALKAGDWDVEVPEAVDDELLSEDGIDTSRTGTCAFLAAIENFKILPIYLDLYNIIYAVGITPPNYEDTVRGLETRLQDWQDQWPMEFKDNATYPEMSKLQVHYLNMWKCHVQLLLRHPSLSLTKSPQFNAESLSKCLEASRNLLFHVKELQANRGLDITWQTSALYVLAIATTLYGHWERRTRMNLQTFGVLKQDMQDWLSIMTDMDTLLGAGGKLAQSVRTVIDTILTFLSQCMVAMAGSQPHRPQMAPRQHQPSPPRPTNPTNNDIRQMNDFPCTDSDCAKHPDSTLTPQSASLPSQPLSNYTHRPQYHHHHAPRSEYTPDLSQQLDSASPSTGFMATYSQPSYSSTYAAPNPAPTPEIGQAPGSPSAWRHFTGNLIPHWGSSQGPDYMSPASALMQLGGVGGGSSSSSSTRNDIQQREGMPAAPQTEHRQNNVYGDAPMWPMSLFEQPPNVSGI